MSTLNLNKIMRIHTFVNKIITKSIKNSFKKIYLLYKSVKDLNNKIKLIIVKIYVDI